MLKKYIRPVLMLVIVLMSYSCSSASKFNNSPTNSEKIATPYGTNNTPGPNPTNNIVGEKTLESHYLTTASIQNINNTPTIATIPPTKSIPNYQIAFISGGDIYLTTQDGKSTEKLTDSHTITMFRWAPDGNHLFYYRNDLKNQLVDYDVEQRHEKKISLPNITYLSTFAISSDGQKLFLAQTSGDIISSSLTIVDINSLRILTTIQPLKKGITDSPIENICFTPTINQVILVYCAQTCGLSLLNLDTLEFKKYKDFVFGISMTCFPNKDSVAIDVVPSSLGLMKPSCTIPGCNTPDGIYNFNLDNKELTPLVLSNDFGQPVTSQSISMDGNFLLFQVGNSYDNANIKMMDLSTKKIVDVTAGYSPAWRP